MSFLDISQDQFETPTFPIPDGEVDPFGEELEPGTEAVVTLKKVPFRLISARANDWNNTMLFVNLVAVATYPDGSEHKGEVTYKIAYDKVLKDKGNGKPSKDFITLRQLGSFANALGVLDTDALEAAENASDSAGVVARALSGSLPAASFVGTLRWRRSAFEGNEGNVIQYDTTEVQSMHKVEIDVPF